MKSFVKTALVALALGASFTSPVIATEKPGTMLVLDASGSMWGQIDGVNKITIARDVVGEILSDFPADQPLGFVTYGHRERGQCADIQTIIEPAPDTAHEIIKIVNELNPRGMTPMTDAVIAAAQSLRHTEQKATVILISDGIETCNPDPCAAARALADVGIDFTAHVIGFDVKGEAEALMQMQCIAEETGGRFLTADNADELSAALQEVTQVAVAEILSPGSLTLRAVLDNENGPEITDPIVWNIVGPDTNLEGENNPLMLSPKSGVYSITGYHVVFEQTQTAEITFVESADRTYTMVFKTPTPSATLIAPDSAASGSVIEIGWTGPNGERDNIQIAPIGGRYLDWVYTKSGNPVRLQMPAHPGEYELRYSFQDKEVIQTRPITVTAAELGLVAPDSAEAGLVIEIGWIGPNADRDNIQIAPIGGRYLDWVYTKSGNPVRLQMPAHPGEYELRYSFQDKEVIQTRPITVTAAELGLVAPDSAEAGSVIEVGWTGPNADRDNIQIAPVGGRYADWKYTKSGNPVRLTVPDEPGDYELRYSFRDREILITRPITITAAE